MTIDNPAQHLVEVLKEREVPLTGDDVLWAFQSAKTKDDAERWVREYLAPNTLLTKDEAELFRKISRASFHQRHGAAAPSEVTPFEDEEIKAAIRALQSSTIAIDKQCEALRVQKEAIVALQANNKPKHSVERTQGNRQRHQIEEKNKLDAAVQDTRNEINESISTAQRATKAAHGSLVASATEVLNSDDRTMARISNILKALKARDELKDDTKQIEKWCETLTSLRAACVRGNVEVTYESAMTEPIPSGIRNMTQGELLQEKDALDEELDTLRAEIDSVAGMVVEHDFRVPILRSKQKVLVHGKGIEQQWLDHVCMTLRYLVDRLEATGSQTRDLVGYRTAIEEIQSTVSEIVETASATTASASTAMKRRSTVSGQVPKQTMEEIPEIISELSRRTEFPSLNDNLQDYMALLEKAKTDRTKTLRDHHAASARSITDVLAEALEQAESDSRDVLGSLYCNTKYATVSLSNKALDLRADKLDGEMNEVKRTMAGTEAAGSNFDENKIDRLIERWT